MKNMTPFRLITSLLAATALVACTSPATTGSAAAAPAAPLQTPAQIAAQICPPVQAALAGLNALAGLPAGAKADLDAVTPLVAGVCAADATVNFASLQTLEQSALPAIVNAVKASGMAVEQQNSVILDITAAQMILTAVTQAQANEAAATTTATTGAPAAEAK